MIRRFAVILLPIVVVVVFTGTAARAHHCSSGRQFLTTTVLFASSSSSSKQKRSKKNAKRKKVTSSSSSGGGGTRGFFGGKIVSFADIYAKYPSSAVLRMGDASAAAQTPCPCRQASSPNSHEGNAVGTITDDKLLQEVQILSYRDCCQPYHNTILFPNSTTTSLDSRYPETPLKVLQTRYTAFVYRLIPYIMATTHESNGDYRTNRWEWADALNQSMFDSFEFVSLQVRNESSSIIVKEEEAASLTTATIDFEVTLRSKENLSEGGDPTVVVVEEHSKFVRHEKRWLYAGGQVRTKQVQ